jgi:phospholipase D-like protein
VHAIFLTTFWEVLAWITIASLLVLTLAMFAWLFLDIFRRRDLSGLGKAGWACLIFVLPLLGAFIYLIARPRSANYEQEGIVDWAPQPGRYMSPTEEVSYAKQLLDQGTITEKEFEEVKWNATH